MMNMMKRGLAGNLLSKCKSIGKEALGQASLVVSFFGLLHVTNNYLFSSTVVYGPSMLPTINLSGDVLLTEHLSHRFGNLRPGDIILLRSPLDPNKTVAKRIIGMEGDRVTFLPEGAGHNGSTRTIVVPKGHIWVQGDNMYASCDSRYFGPVPFGLVQGKVFLRFTPLAPWDDDQENNIEGFIPEWKTWIKLSI